MGKKNFGKKPESERKDLAPTEFVCIIDRSGSMSSIRDDAIGGFNTFLKKQQEMQGAAFLTMVQFDHEYIVVHDGEPIEHVKPLDHSSYVPRGTTALYDAIGRAITTVRERYEKPGADPARIMVVILTDGQENNSHEYDRARITGMIKTCTDTLKWAFLYLSASPDAFADGSRIGLGANTMHFTHSHAGGQSVGAVYAAAAVDYRNTGSIGTMQSYATQADPSGKNLRTQTSEQ
jgi:hypothetical protein